MARPLTRTVRVLIPLTPEEDATIREAAAVEGVGHTIVIREGGLDKAKSILRRKSAPPSSATKNRRV